MGVVAFAYQNTQMRKIVASNHETSIFTRILQLFLVFHKSSLQNMLNLHKKQTDTKKDRSR